MITCPVCNCNVTPNLQNATFLSGMEISNMKVFSCNEHFNITVCNKMLTSIHIKFQDFSIMGGYLITTSGKWIDDTSWCDNMTIDNFNDCIQKAKKFMKYKAFL